MIYVSNKGVDQYEHHNVLEDVEFKEGMKEYS